MTAIKIRTDSMSRLSSYKPYVIQLNGKKRNVIKVTEINIFLKKALKLRYLSHSLI